MESSVAGPGRPFVLAAAATGIVEQIESRGGDVDSIFGNTGVSPSMAGSPTLQIGLTDFCRLFEESAHRTGDGNFGLWVGNQFRPHDLGLWGYLAVCSPTLGAALQNIIETFPCHQQHSLLDLSSRGDGRLMLRYQIRAPDIVERRQDAELSLGMFLNIFRECLGRGWTPRRSISNTRGPPTPTSTNPPSELRSASRSRPMRWCSVRTCWNARCHDATRR